MEGQEDNGLCWFGSSDKMIMIKVSEIFFPFQGTNCDIVRNNYEITFSKILQPSIFLGKSLLFSQNLNFYLGLIGTFLSNVDMVFYFCVCVISIYHFVI